MEGSMIETRLPAHAEWIEVLVSAADAAVLEAMELGEAVGEERGRVVFAHDDTDAVERTLASLRTAH
jgi:hypothetical protein